MIERGESMKTYEITARVCGVKKTTIVKAESKQEALKIAWSLGYEDVYVDEVK